MPRRKPIDPLIEVIRIEVPQDLKGDKRLLERLCETRKRNLHNVDYIDHITIQEVKNSDGSVGLVPLVVAKPLPSGCHGSLVWITAVFTRQPRFFS
jgi:hypothetical protein